MAWRIRPPLAANHPGSGLFPVRHENFARRLQSLRTGSYELSPSPCRTSNAPRNATKNCSTTAPSCGSVRSTRDGLSPPPRSCRAIDVHTLNSMATALWSVSTPLSSHLPCLRRELEVPLPDDDVVVLETPLRRESVWVEPVAHRVFPVLDRLSKKVVVTQSSLLAKK